MIFRLRLRLVSLLIVLCWWLPVFPGQSTAIRHRLQKTNWTTIRGVNYVPSYSRNPYEIWRYFNADAFDRELAMASRVGYTSVRLWLNYFAYQDRPKEMLADFKTALILCRKHNLKAVVVLFDACGATQKPDGQIMKVSDAYQFLLSSPRLSDKLKEIVKFNYDSYAHGFGKDVEVRVSDSGSPHVLLWQDWQPSPGYEMLGPKSWAKLDRYIRDVVGQGAGDETIMAWDLMNEPEFATEEPFTKGLNLPEVKDKVGTFLRHVRDVIKKSYPDELLTIGFANLENCKEFEPLADVLTYHVYGEPTVLEKSISEAVAFGAKANKPIFITETMANFTFMPFEIEALASDEGQLKHYQKVVPTLVKAKIGWMAWGLVVGRNFNPYCDIFYANGTPRPAAGYLERALKGH